MKLIELLLVIKFIIFNIRNQIIFALQDIVENCRLSIVEHINLKVKDKIRLL